MNNEEAEMTGLIHHFRELFRQLISRRNPSYCTLCVQELT